MISDNKIVIGNVNLCGTALLIKGNVRRNDIQMGAIEDCVNGVVVEGETRSLQEQLGLPEDTKVEAILQALVCLRAKSGETLEEKTAAMKPLAIWEWLKRAGDASKLVKTLADSLNSPAITEQLSRLTGHF